MDYLDNVTMGGSTDYTTFDDGSTIVDTPKMYNEKSWGASESSLITDNSTNSAIFLAGMSILFVLTLIGAPLLVWHLYKTTAAAEPSGGTLDEFPRTATTLSTASNAGDSSPHLHL
jgi:hypothetical protein